MNPKQPTKYKYEFASIELIGVEIKQTDYAARLDRAAKALYPFLTSSESLEKFVNSGEIEPSSIHLHEQPTTQATSGREKDVSDGKDEPKTAA